MYIKLDAYEIGHIRQIDTDLFSVQTQRENICFRLNGVPGALSAHSLGYGLHVDVDKFHTWLNKSPYFLIQANAYIISQAEGYHDRLMMRAAQRGSYISLSDSLMVRTLHHYMWYYLVVELGVLCSAKPGSFDPSNPPPLRNRDL